MDGMTGSLLATIALVASFCGAPFLLLNFPALAAAAAGQSEFEYEYAPGVPGFPAGYPGRSGSAAAAVITGSASTGSTSRVVVHGGISGTVPGTYHDDLFLFDLEANTVAVLNQTNETDSRPSARFGHRAEWLGGQFMMCQGFSSSGGYQNDCWTYNLTSSNWTKLFAQTSSSLPAVYYPATTVVVGATSLRESFLTWGGYNGDGDGPTNALWRIDPSVDGTAELVVNLTAVVPPEGEGAVLVRKGATDVFLLLGGSNARTRVYELVVLTDLTGNWTLLTESTGWIGFIHGIGMWDSVNNIALFGFASPTFGNRTMYCSDGTGAAWTALSSGGEIPEVRSLAGYAPVVLANGGAALFAIGGINNGTRLSDGFLLRATNVPTTASTGGRSSSTTAAAGVFSTMGDTISTGSTASTGSMGSTGARLAALGPNLTIGVPAPSCNVSVFNATAFAEQFAAAYVPEYNVDPSDVVVLDVRCVGDVLQVTFAILGTSTGATGGSLPPPPPSLVSNGSGGTAFSGTTWTIISWPRFTTSTTEPASLPSSSARVKTSSGTNADEGSSAALIVGIVAGVFFCVAFTACAVILVLRKSRANIGSVEALPLENVPRDSQKSPQTFTVVKLLGSGNFGAVYEGRLDGTSKRVAIKEIRSGSADELRREADMLMRCQHEFVVQLLGMVGSDAIAVAPGCPALLGSGGCGGGGAAYSGSVFMLTELCEYGSLQDALRRAQSGVPGVAVLSLETLSASWLLQVLWQVSEAMRFLTCDAKVLHRDLAARNVLLARASDGYASGLSNSSGLGICARVSDFGLSESMYAAYYIRGLGTEKLPLRWTAPEALLKHKFSESSDVYSFGALIVETLNMGREPLSLLPNAVLVEKITEALKVSSPYLADFNSDKPFPFVAPGTQEPLNEGLWELALQCLSLQADARPKFADCAVRLEQFLAEASLTVFVPPPRSAAPSVAEHTHTRRVDDGNGYQSLG